MRSLTTTLSENMDLLHVLAEVWNVAIKPLTSDEIPPAIEAAMLQASAVEMRWDALDDASRAALQMIVSSDNKMSKGMFERVHGKIRKMGRGAIAKEQPHLRPQSVSEGLFYQGFIAEAFDKHDGFEPIIYIPEELVPLLPLHQTSYDDVEDEPLELPFQQISPLDDDDVDGKQPADTSIVDDMTTLLAYLRIQPAPIVNNTLCAEDQVRLLPYLIKQDANRLAFLLAIGVGADLISTQDGRVYPKRSGIPGWLGATRARQLHLLVDAWNHSSIYQDLWHVPGLQPEGGWAYDAVASRSAFIHLLQDLVPMQNWWSVDDFIDMVKKNDPDFQRPGGDYDSWYIRNERGEYLKGFESWDAVDGALLEFYFDGPMHWLGLIDLAEGATAVRLNAYGRAFINGDRFPQPADPEERIQFHEDGVFSASRKVSRMDRFQLARFTTWGDPGTPYQYILNADGIQAAAEQGITTQHIAAFINRQLDGDPMPDSISRLLDNWQIGTAVNVSIETLIVLRTAAAETMDRIYNEPAFRRYLGARLGQTACIIRADDGGAALQAALEEHGIPVEVIA